MGTASGKSLRAGDLNMRIIVYSAVAIIPALLAVALVVQPVETTSEPSPVAPTTTASSLLEYVPPSHVRVIPIYDTATSR
jgi:hypothetical protein